MRVRCDSGYMDMYGFTTVLRMLRSIQLLSILSRRRMCKCIDTSFMVRL